MVFTTLALLQLGHALAVRSETESLFRLGLRSNVPLTIAVVGTILVQLALVFVPALRPVFGTEALIAAPARARPPCLDGRIRGRGDREVGRPPTGPADRLRPQAGAVQAGPALTVRALRLTAPAPAASGPLQLVELADHEPAADELLVAVTACAVCRTDLQLCEGDLPARTLPIVPGHQAVGRVAAVGPDVVGWTVGDRAGVAWLAGTCGTCTSCTTGRENLCADARFTGWDRDGGYATRIAVNADFALRLPDGFDDLAAAPLLCGGVIGYRSLRVSGIEPGGRLGLFGFGASALLALQVARHWGCEVHVRTRSAREQERAHAFGAATAATYDVPTPPLDAAVTFAPSGDVVVAALRNLGRGGTVAINAIHLDRIPEFPYEPLWWERGLRSVANFTRTDAREFLQLAATIPIRTEIQAFPLAEGNDALRRLAAGELDGTAILVTDEG